MRFIIKATNSDDWNQRSRLRTSDNITHASTDQGYFLISHTSSSVVAHKMPLRRPREPDLGQRIAALQQSQASHKRGKRIVGGIPLVLPGLGMKQSRQQSKSHFLKKSKHRLLPQQQHNRMPEVNDENQSEEWARFSDAAFTLETDDNENSKIDLKVDGSTSRQKLSTKTTPLSPCNRNLEEFTRRTTDPINVSHAHPDSSRSVNGKIKNFFSTASRVESEIDNIIDMTNYSRIEERRKPPEREFQNGKSTGLNQSLNKSWDPWYNDQVFITGTFDSDNGKEVLLRNDPPGTSTIRDAPNSKSSASLSTFGSANDDRDMTDDPPYMNLAAYYQNRSARGRLGIVERIDVFSPESVSNRKLDDLCEPVQRNRPRHNSDIALNSRQTCITPRTTNPAKETDLMSRDECSSLTRSSAGRWNNVHHQSTLNADPKNKASVMTFIRLPDVPEGKTSSLETLQSPVIKKAKSQLVEIRTTGDIEFELYDPKIHGPIRQSQFDGVQKRRQSMHRSKKETSVQRTPQREANASQFNSEADEIDKLLAILDPSSVAKGSETRKPEPLASMHMHVSQTATVTSSKHLESTKGALLEYNEFVRSTGVSSPSKKLDRPEKCIGQGQIIDDASEANLISHGGKAELPCKGIKQNSFASNNGDMHHLLDNVTVDHRKQGNKNNQSTQCNSNSSSKSPFPTFMTDKTSQRIADNPSHFSLPDDNDRSPVLTTENHKIKTPNSDSKILPQDNGHLLQRNMKYLERRAYASESIRKYWQDYSNVRSRGSFDSLSEAVYSGVNSSMNQAAPERHQKAAGEQKTFEERKGGRDYSLRNTTDVDVDTVSGCLDLRKEKKEGRSNEKSYAKNNLQNQYEKSIRLHGIGCVQNVEFRDKNYNDKDLQSAGVHSNMVSSQTWHPLQTTWENDLASLQLSLKESEALHELKNRARSISEKYDKRNCSSQKIIDPPQITDRSISSIDFKEQRKSSHVDSNDSEKLPSFSRNYGQDSSSNHIWNHMPQRNMDPPQIGNSEFGTKGNDRSSPHKSDNMSSLTQRSFERTNKQTSERDLILPPRSLEPPQTMKPIHSTLKRPSKEQDRESSISQMNFEVAKTLHELRNRAQLLSTKHKHATNLTNENEEIQLSDALFSLNESVTLKELRNRVQAISSRYSTLTARAVEEYAEKIKHQQKPRKSDFKCETQSLLSSGSLDSDMSVSSRFENEDYRSTGQVYDNVSFLTDENDMKICRRHHESSRERNKRPHSEQNEFTGYSRRGRNKGSFDSLNFMTSASQLKVNQIMHERPSNNLTRRYDRRNDGTGTNILPPFYERDTTDQSNFDEPSTQAPTPILSNVKTNSGDANSEYSDEDEHSTADKETDVNPGCSFVCGGVDVCALLGGRWCGSCVNNS
jgi:hypothetical protein